MANTNSTQHAQLAAQNGEMVMLWATREIATIQSAADTITMFTIPAGTTVHGGWLRGDDLDAHATTPTLELDVGDASSATRLLDGGVASGDAVVGTKPEAGICVPLFGTLKDGPYTYTTATDIIVTVEAAAATTGTGTLTLWMKCTQRDVRVSPPNKGL